jgi:hypothetical protein
MKMLLLFTGGHEPLGIRPRTVVLDVLTDGTAVAWTRQLLTAMATAQTAADADRRVSAAQSTKVLTFLAACCTHALHKMRDSVAPDREARRERAQQCSQLIAMQKSTFSVTRAGTEKSAKQASSVVALQRLAAGVRGASPVFLVQVMQDVGEYVTEHGVTSTTLSQQALAGRAALLPRVALALYIGGTGWPGFDFVTEMVLLETVFFRHVNGTRVFETTPPFLSTTTADAPRRVLLGATSQVLMAWLVATLPFETLDLFHGWPGKQGGRVQGAKRGRAQ